MAALGLHCYVQAFSSCDKQGLHCSSNVWASHCQGFSCCRGQALKLGLSSYGTLALVGACGSSSLTKDRTGAPMFGTWSPTTL